jgi:hypothetical protein
MVYGQSEGPQQDMHRDEEFVATKERLGGGQQVLFAKAIGALVRLEEKLLPKGLHPPHTGVCRFDVNAQFRDQSGSGQEQILIVDQRRLIKLDRPAIDVQRHHDRRGWLRLKRSCEEEQRE